MNKELMERFAKLISKKRPWYWLPKYESKTSEVQDLFAKDYIKSYMEMKGDIFFQMESFNDILLDFLKATANVLIKKPGITDFPSYSYDKNKIHFNQEEK